MPKLSILPQTLRRIPMGSTRIRKPRRDTLLTAHLRADTGWGQVVLCNISERGMMLSGHNLPSRGSFVEVRCGDLSIAGQVRWSSGQCCGISAREAVNISGVSDDLISTPVPAALRHARRSAPVSPELAAQQSRAVARAINFALALLAMLAAATFVAESVSRSLGDPLSRVSDQLSDPDAD